MQRLTLLLLFLLTFSLSAYAESRYVTDQVLIALRPAQNDTAEPLEYLPTGMRVEVVEDLGTFIKIKSATGKVGFARSKYFLTTPIKETAAAAGALQERLSAAIKQNEELSAEILQLKTTPVIIANTESPKDLEKCRAETATTIKERDELINEVARLKETAKSSASSTSSPAGNQVQWLLAGATILLVGWFIGKSSRSKRRF